MQLFPQLNPHHIISMTWACFSKEAVRLFQWDIHIHIPLCAHRATETPPSIWAKQVKKKKKKFPIKQTTPPQPGLVPTAKLMLNNCGKVSLSREKDGSLLSGKKNCFSILKGSLSLQVFWGCLGSSAAVNLPHWLFPCCSRAGFRLKLGKWDHVRGDPGRRGGCHENCHRGALIVMSIWTLTEETMAPKKSCGLSKEQKLSQHSSQCHTAVGSCRPVLKGGILQQGFVLGLKQHLPCKLRDKSKDQHFHSG